MNTVTMNALCKVGGLEHTGKIKRTFTVEAKGKSRNEAKEKCWKEIKTAVNKEYSNIPFTVKAVSYE